MADAERIWFPRQFVAELFDRQKISKGRNDSLVNMFGDVLITFSTPVMFDICPCDLGNGEIALLHNSRDLHANVPSFAMIYAKNVDGVFEPQHDIACADWRDTLASLARRADTPSRNAHISWQPGEHDRFLWDPVPLHVVLSEAAQYIPAEASSAFWAFEDAGQTQTPPARPEMSPAIWRPCPAQ